MSISDIAREESERVIAETEKRYGEVNHFVDGQKDCRDGVPHVAGKHPDYDRGYAFEYEMGEVQSALSLQRIMQNGPTKTLGLWSRITHWVGSITGIHWRNRK